MSVEPQNQDLLLRPADSDWYDRYQVAFANTVAILLVGGTAVVIAIFLAAGEPARLRGPVPFLVVGLAGWVLLQKGQERLACPILVYGIWACAINALFWTHGLTGTTIGVLVVALAFAGWLAGPTSAIVLTVATPPVLYLLAYLEVTGWPISVIATVTPYQRALFYSLTALGGGALGYFGAASLRERLRRLLESERDLSARLAELQGRDEALRQSEQKYAAVFNTVPDALAVTRRSDATHLELNAAWEKLAGHPRDRALGRSALELGIWADPAERVALLSRLDREGTVVNFPTRFVRADGRSIDVLVSAVQYDVSGEPCVVWSWTDISDLRQAERKAESSFKRFAAVFENSPDPILILRLRDQVILAVNDAWSAVNGSSREQVVGRPSAEVSRWAQADRAALIEQVKAKGRVTNWLATIARADGTMRQALISAVLTELDDEPCVIFMGRDVSELRAAELALAESEKRYRSLFKAASDCILVIDRDGRLVDINDQGSRTLGYSREELLGEPFTRVLDAQLLSRLYPRPADVLVERRSVRGEQELVSRSGSRHMVEFVASPLPDGNVLAIVRDVTERKRVEQLLVNIGRGVSAEVGEAFFDSLVLSLCTHLGADYSLIGEVLAPDSRRIRTRAFVADGEVRPNFEYDLEGSPCVNALTRRGTVAYPDHVADLFPADAGLRRLGVEGYVGTSLLSVDGLPLGILLVMSRRPIENVPLWCSVLEIFASRAAAEIERSRAEREVRSLNLSLERKVAERTAELQAANRELESFSYSVSHDLRTPLRGIAGFIGALRADYGGLFTGEPMRYLERIERGARRMGQLIDDLLKFSRDGRRAIARQRLQMRPLVDSVMADLLPAWGNSAKVEIGDLPPASCDPALVRQVWQNLIGNALKFSSKGAEPKIEIGGTRQGNRVEYWVRDNGAGFDMAYADKLFGVFQRLHTASEFEGTGIGLATVQRIVERHGGSVSAEGQPGLGATFRFTLPAGELD